MRTPLFVLALTGFLRLFGFATDPWLKDRDIHHVHGEPARVARVWTEDEPLRIVTWNIERGAAYGEVLSVLRRLDADILLLQEVDRFCRRTGYRDVARDLAQALDMNWVSAGEFQEIGEARARQAAITGQATLSRFPIEGAEVLRFKAQDRWRWSINPVQPRRGGRMALKARTAGILTYNTHIESGGRVSLQRRQMAEILADEAVEAAQGTPVLIGGDFNNGPRLGAPIFEHLTAAAFIDGLGELGQRGPTSRGQRQPIDWIFTRHGTPVEGRGRIVHAPAASDHSPVMAVLAFAPSLAGSR